MTVSVRVSVNGNYKLPVSFKQGDREESFVISGKGSSTPVERNITFYHGPDVMSLSVGPEEEDKEEKVEDVKTEEPSQ